MLSPSTCGLLLAAAQLVVGAGGPPIDPKYEDRTWTFDLRILIALGAVVVALAAYRVVILSVRYIRTLTSLNNDTQSYFSKPNTAYAFIREHILYAPLFRRRHNQELRLSSAVSMGILPTRFQFIFLAAVVGMNAAFCVVDIPWEASSTKYMPVVRNRTGSLAVVNLIPLVLMAARNNPLIACLNISFDNFNLMHRWFGRMVIVEAVVHMLCWMVPKVQSRKSFPHSLCSTVADEAQWAGFVLEFI